MCIVFLTQHKIGLRLHVRSWEFLLGLLICYIGLHSLWPGRPDVGLPAFLQLSCFVALLLILTESLTERYQKTLWLIIGVSMGISALLSIFEYFGSFSFMLRPTGEVVSGRLNPAGLIGDVNSGGFLFGLTSLILLYGLLGQKDRKVRLFSGGLLVLNLTGLVFTRTLTALLALGVALLFWVFFHYWWMSRSYSGRRRASVFLLTVFTLFLGLGALVMSEPGLRYRFQRVGQQFRSGDWSVATAGRYPVYLLTWEMIKDRPWFGHGLNTFKEDFFHYRSDTEFGRNLKLSQEAGSYQEAHNEYLQIWEELGIPGLGLFLLLFSIPLFRGIRLLRATKDPSRAYWVGVNCLGVVYVAVNCLGFFPLHVTVTGSYIVLLFGGLRHFQSDLQVAETQAIRVTPWKPVLLIGLLIFPFYLQLQKWKANSEAGQASFFLQQAASENGSTRRRALAAKVARERLQSAEKRFPWMPELYNLQGSAALFLGQHQLAIGYYGKAVTYMPSPETFTNLGAAYLVAQRYDLARINVQTALDYNPSFSRARKALEFMDTSGY